MQCSTHYRRYLQQTCLKEWWWEAWVEKTATRDLIGLGSWRRSQELASSLGVISELGSQS